MAGVYISEHKNAASPIGTYAPDVLPQPPLAVQAFSATGAGVISAGFSSKTYAVLLIADTACWYLFGGGTGGTAATGATGPTGAMMYLPANVPFTFAVAPGQKVAFST